MTRSRDLTRRELECLRRASEGQVSNSIAQDLGIETRTVEAHMANAMRKLGAHTRAEAVAHAFRQGFLK
ncbi:MAG: helix-turn-helix transcriptional regulator [Pseudomonadota bacterium]